MTQVLLESHVHQKEYCHHHSVTLAPDPAPGHVTPPDAHVPQELLAEHAFRELPVVNQQLLAHPSKPLEKFGASVAQTPSTPSGGPRNHVERYEHGRHEVLRGHEMEALHSRELNF